MDSTTKKWHVIATETGEAKTVLAPTVEEAVEAARRTPRMLFSTRYRVTEVPPATVVGINHDGTTYVID